MVKKSLSKAKYWGPGGLTMTPTDREIFREEIDWFLPRKVFDIHVHLHAKVKNGSPAVSMRLVKNFQKMVFPGRKCNDLILPVAMGKQTAEEVNKFAFREMRKLGEKDDATLIFAEPKMPAEYVREQVIKNAVVGLKVYMTRGTAKDKANAPVRSFLAEKHMKVMDELGLMVMLHLSKPRAISDPGNIADIERFSTRYLNSKWVLAHCGRCFRPGLFEKVVDRLNKLPNVYVETSAVCDPLVFMEIFKNYDPSRLMFGSDNVLAGGMRGRYVETGLFWSLLGRQGFQWRAGVLLTQPTFVVYEQLRAMSRAAKLVGLGKRDIRNIFWNNAIRLIRSIRQAQKTV